MIPSADRSSSCQSLRRWGTKGEEAAEAEGGEGREEEEEEGGAGERVMRRMTREEG